MEIEARHSDLRNRLDGLGFGQPLPLSAIGIVSAILDDLIQTSEKLKSANQQIELLHQEKAAWELGVEPFKCDNSRLLAECNELHLELIRQQDKHILANTELRSRIRSLQSEKRQLEEKHIQADSKLRELQAAGISENVKSRKDIMNKQRKPFVSTVRAGAFYQPPKCCDHGMHQPGTDVTGTSRCPCLQKQADVLNEMDRLRVEINQKQEVIDAMQNRVNSRDREIQRLTSLFAGGRPAAALAKDCCYRDINRLGNDVAALQLDKLSLQQKLNEAQEMHERTSKNLTRLSEKNKLLEQELHEIEQVALKVESAANADILERDRKCSDLEVRLQRSQLRIQELESMVEFGSDKKPRHHSDSSTSSCYGQSVEVLQAALKQAMQEKLNLYKQLNELKDREHAHLGNIETINKEYSKLKQKYSQLEQKQQQRKTASEIDSTEMQRKVECLQKYCSDLETRLQRLTEGRDLHAECNSQRRTTASSHSCGRLKTGDSFGSGQSSLSVKAAIHRIERERDVAKSEVRQLEQERDALREKLKQTQRTQQEELAKHESLLAGYSQQIAHLEADNRDLQGGKSGVQIKMKMLKEENRSLQSRVKELEENYSKLKLSHSQLKMVLSQTERALLQHQDRVMCAETKLATAECKLNQVGNTVDDAETEIGTLKGEISVLKASNASLVREKNKLLVELDQKTELLCAAEAELKSSKSKQKELQRVVDQMQQTLDNVSSDNIHKESTLRSVSTETDTLKKQMATLKRKNDNVLTENGRLSNELTDALAELTQTKRQLRDSQQEVERMKTQLREYVQEMQRAEELLSEKEREREQMLERYKSLSEGVNILETSNHTLEAETSEARKLLQDAEDRISSLEQLVNEREQNIRECERQLNELSAQLAATESELESVREEKHALAIDLEATKELCHKLDLQKDKLNAELEEHSNIREQLAREKGTLQRELTLTRNGDRVAVDGLQELLAASRAEVEQLRIAMAKLRQESEKLSVELESLRSRLAEEQERSRRSEALASEYGVQVQELKRRIVDERFARTQSRTTDTTPSGEGDTYNNDDTRYPTM
uniref:Centrosomal protein of 135 kDa n=1 Tax=Anopheles farauti TaxID=69004 RepID=A0A499FV14_9DIPT